MRRSPSVSTLLAAIATLTLAPALAAQTTGSTPAASRPPGCRGTNTQTSSITLASPGGSPVVFPSYPQIESVQPGSPAEKAGMRPNDVVVLQDGRDLVGNPPTQPRLAGDTVVFVVRRGEVEVPLTVVLGRWDPPQEAPGVTRVCRPLVAEPSRN
jgi:membrane-associated protease RseP (regulator of RpoE activity)